MPADTVKPDAAQVLPLRAERPSMTTAKRLMSQAAEAVLRNDPRAIRMATVALAALQAATEGAGKMGEDDAS